jgi:hypothetical protein
VDDVRGPSRSKATRCPWVASGLLTHQLKTPPNLSGFFRDCRATADSCSALASFRMGMSESASSTSTYARAGISGWLNRAHSRISLIRDVTMGVRYSG